MKTGRSLVELATELERQNTAKRDLVADASALSVYPDNDRLSLNINPALWRRINAEV